MLHGSFLCPWVPGVPQCECPHWPGCPPAQWMPIDLRVSAESVHRWSRWVSTVGGLGHHRSVSRRPPLLLPIVPSSPQSGGIFTYLVSIALHYCGHTVPPIWCPLAAECCWDASAAWCSEMQQFTLAKVFGQMSNKKISDLVNFQ